MGPTAKMVSMAAAPALLRCRVPKGKARMKRLPMASIKHNIITCDENALVTFGSKDYPAWVRRSPALPCLLPPHRSLTLLALCPVL